MKLELEEPYKSDFKSAYCYTNKEPRRVVSLIRENGDRTSTSYARYLMACHLGRYLNQNEHVDHINENAMDDRIDNLQILSPTENHCKSNKTGKRYLKMNCPVCGETFEREYRLTNMGKRTGNYQTCSRSCGGKASHMESGLLQERFTVLNDYHKIGS